MQPNKTKIALVIGALMLGVSATSNAATGTFDITVATVEDVKITPITELDFGANIFTTAAGTCTLDAAQPATDDMQMSTAASVVAGTDYTKLDGAGCITGNAGTPGKYKISGASDTIVNITIDPVTAADFSFTPDSNAIVNYGTTAGVDDDTLVALTPGVSLALRTPTTADIGGTVNNVVASEILFVIGGTLTVGAADLTPSTPYADVFHVNVVY